MLSSSESDIFGRPLSAFALESRARVATTARCKDKDCKSKGCPLPLDAFETFKISGKRKLTCLGCSALRRAKPSNQGKRKKEANAISNAKWNPISNAKWSPIWNPIKNSVNNSLVAAKLKQRKQEALFTATGRSIAEQNALITNFTAEAIAEIDSVLAGLYETGSKQVLIYVFVTWYDRRPDKRWMNEALMFLGKRGGGNPVLLDAEGDHLKTKALESMFTIHEEPIAITDAHVINDAVEKAVHVAYNCVPRTLKLWRRPGAGTCNHHHDPDGKTREYCVGFAHCDARNVPEGTTCNNSDGNKGPRILVSNKRN